MRDKHDIEDLIRSALDNAEVPPSSKVWSGVQRKLRWKKFMRFSPGKPNIFYLAGILVAGTTMTLILTREPLKDEIPVKSGVQVEVDRQEGLLPENMTKIEETESEVTGIQPVEPKAAPRNRVLNTTPSHDQSDEQDRNGETSKGDDGRLDPDKDSGNMGTERPVQSTLVTYFISSVQSGCAPLKVAFINESVNAVTSNWRIGTSAVSEEKNPEYTFTEPGKHTVTLTAEGTSGQSSAYQQVIEVLPSPKAEFEIEEGLEGVDGHVALNLVNYSDKAMACSWMLVENHNHQQSNTQTVRVWRSNEFQPTLKLTDIRPATEQVILIVTNEYGCVDTSAQPLPVVMESSRTRIRFPNAFSPSPFGPTGGHFSPNERRTDVFHPVFTEAPVEYNLKIYSRRGELIFSSVDVYRGWDGYLQQERALGGVYVWMAEGIWPNGEEFKLHGDLTLIWKEIW